MIFLISSSEHRQLPTIRSRSQLVRFQSLQRAEIEEILTLQSRIPEGLSIPELALACDGSLQMALQLADPEILSFRRHWLEQLASLDPGSEDFFEVLNAFVDAAGKDAAMKRHRLRLVADLAIAFYRNIMVCICGQSVEGDETMVQHVQQAVPRWPGDAETAAACVERSAEVREQVAANANQTLIVESLLSDLGRLVRQEVWV